MFLLAAAIPMVRRGGGRQRALRASCARRHLTEQGLPPGNKASMNRGRKA